MRDGREGVVFLVGTNDLGWARLREILAGTPEVRVVEAPIARQAAPSATALRPDVIFVTPDLGGASTLPLMRDLRAGCPGSRLVVFAARYDDAWADELVELCALGIKAFLVWSELSPQGLEYCVRALIEADIRLANERVAQAFFAAEERRRQPPAGRVRPTRREREVLDLLAEGATEHEIADRLVISLRTVEAHVGNVCKKLDARSRFHCAILAIRYGLIPR